MCSWHCWHRSSQPTTIPKKKNKRREGVARVVKKTIIKKSSIYYLVLLLLLVHTSRAVWFCFTDRNSFVSFFFGYYYHDPCVVFSGECVFMYVLQNWATTTGHWIIEEKKKKDFLVEVQNTTSTWFLLFSFWIICKLLLIKFIYDF